MHRRPSVFVVLIALVVILSGSVRAQPTNAERQAVDRFLGRYCLTCHNDTDKAAGLDLESVETKTLDRHPETWEKVVRKLAARQMPPPNRKRPGESEFGAALAAIGDPLDRRAAEHPDPGRTETFRRLNRTEYQNAIRDLLGLDVDASTLLPADESSHGFDNITVGDLSPTLLDRYLTAARKISRLALGNPGRSPGGETFRVRPDITQEEHVEGLPIGTRGGTLINYTFPQDGDYEVVVRLTRDRNEHVEGLRETHELEILVDRERRAIFLLQPPRNDGEHQTADLHLRTRLSVSAGPHRVGVTFPKKPSSLPETARQPYQAHYNTHRHPRISPAIYEVSITGPLDSTRLSGTFKPLRFHVRQPIDPTHEDSCAREILSRLIRMSYRRPITEEDLQRPMELFHQARAGHSFEDGLEMALAAVLVNPQFLFRIELDPPGSAPGSVYRVSDVALASRLSFFLWSSIPDDELLALAERGELSRPEVLARQVRRMLADPRSRSLVTNFADQWLHLRNLDAITPDLRLFPDFDDNLRQAFRRETESLFEDVILHDRSVLALLKPGRMELNERLAKHYGIPHIYGSRFRAVPVAPGDRRGGLLREGSILTVTSYATRTSPVIRGKWVLENILGTPPPPPPANVPALKDNTIASHLSVRERLAEHRRNIACAGCHRLMDPVGFALENFDAVGRWREDEEGRPVDASGGLPDGRSFDGVDGLEKALLDRPELFVTAMTEKLLTFALGRVVGDRDAPAVRQIVRESRRGQYRFSSLILGIASSPPFQMRRSE